MRGSLASCGGVHCNIDPSGRCRECGEAWELVPAADVAPWLQPHLDMSSTIWRRPSPEGILYRCV